MKNNWVLLASVCVFACTGCKSTPKSEPEPVTERAATAFYVRSSGNDSASGETEATAFKTLTKAVQAASSSVIKTIVVVGTLRENTVMVDTGSRELLITGKHPAAAREKAVLTATADAVITVRVNARVHFEHIEVAGRLDVVKGGAVVLGEGARLTGTSGTLGGGLLVDDALVELRDNALITGITAARFGAVHIKNGGMVSMFGNAQIAGNTVRATFGNDAQQKTAGNGGAVYLEDGLLFMRENAVITENKSDDYGGAVVVNTNSSLIMKDNAVISGNRANSAGGGVAIRAGASLIMKDWAVIANNKACFGGGVMVFTDGIVQMHDNSAVKDNAAIQITGVEPQFGASGGGVYNRGAVTMHDAAAISANTSVTVGGGMYIEKGSLTMHDGALLSHNSAEINGGGVQIAKDGLMTLYDSSAITSNKAIEGGGVMVYGKLALCDSASISGNIANYGNGIYVVKGASATRTGEAVVITDVIYREEPDNALPR
jgi:hypothetical protein